MRVRRNGLAIPIAALVAVAGCGGDSKTESELRKSIAQRTGADVEFVECPKAPQNKGGATGTTGATPRSGSPSPPSAPGLPGAPGGIGTTGGSGANGGTGTTGGTGATGSPPPSTSSGRSFRCKALVAVEVVETDNGGTLLWQITNLSGPPPSGVTPGTSPQSAAGLLPGATGATGPTSPAAAEGGSDSEDGKLVIFKNRPQRYELRRPSHWKKSGSGESVRFSGPAGRYLSVSAGKTGKPDPAIVDRDLRANKSIVNAGKAKSKTFDGESGVSVTFTLRFGKERQVVRRYVFWRAGTRATVEIATPAEFAKRPLFQRRAERIADSFRWL